MQTFSSLRIKLGRFNIAEEHLKEIWKEEQGGKIRLFKLLDVIIKLQYIDHGEFSNIISELCQFHLYYYNNSSKQDLETLSTKLSYSRERLRQVKLEFEKDFNRKFSFLLDIDFIEDTNLNTVASFIRLSDDLIHKINNDNNTFFTQKFITRIFGLFNPRYRYIGDDNNSAWKASYLVSKSVNTDFVLIINMYRIKLRPYPVRKQDQFWNYGDILESPVDTLTPSILEKLIVNEFNKGYYENNALLLPKTKKITLSEKIRQVLTELGPESKGYKLEQIVSRLEIVETKKINPTSVRGIINGDPSFAAYGKTSTYILTEWLDDERLDMIAGDYWRVCQRLLERERYPINILELLDKLRHYRSNPDKNSIIRILGDKSKNIFLFKESFVGLMQSQDHVEFMDLLKNISGSNYSRKIWDKFRSKKQAHKYFEQRGISYAQTEYLIRYMTEEMAPSFKFSSSEKSNLLWVKSTEEDLVSDLSKLNGYSDDYRLTKARREHILLKKLLFKNEKKMACAICGHEFPIKFLAVAHIKRRSLATALERVNRYIVMPACYLGCDMLFEKGYICVNSYGNIEVIHKILDSGNLQMYIDNLNGKRCLLYSDENRAFFAAHRIFHQK